jgi:hypothetical protein
MSGKTVCGRTIAETRVDQAIQAHCYLCLPGHTVGQTLPIYRAFGVFHCLNAVDYVAATFTGVAG